MENDSHILYQMQQNNSCFILNLLHVGQHGVHALYQTFGRATVMLYTHCCTADCLVGLVVKASASKADDPGFDSHLRCEDFSGSSHTSGLKLVLQWLPCLAPGVIGSELGLVCPVSAYRDWMRSKVRSATSVSVWQHVNLSEQVRN